MLLIQFYLHQQIDIFELQQLELSIEHHKRDQMHFLLCNFGTMRKKAHSVITVVASPIIANRPLLLISQRNWISWTR